MKKFVCIFCHKEVEKDSIPRNCKCGATGSYLEVREPAPKFRSMVMKKGGLTRATIRGRESILENMDDDDEDD